MFLRVSRFASVVIIASGSLAVEVAARDKPGRERLAKAAPSPPSPPPPVSAASTTANTASKTGHPLVVAVSLQAQRLTVYQGTQSVLSTPISSGKPGHRTPTGVFAILQRARYHESNLYSNAPMPFMQRLTWSGVALHAGQLPGYPASHGCIRLPYRTAETLFGLLRLGARVVVTDAPVAPMFVQHPNLPQPLPTRIEIAGDGRKPADTVVVAATGNLSMPVSAAARFTDLPPRAAAEHDKRRAAAALIEARATAQHRLALAAEAARAADGARRDREAMEAELAAFEVLAARARRHAALARSEEEQVQADASIYAVDEAIADATAEVQRLRQLELQLFEASFPPARHAREAEDALGDAEAAVRLATVGTAPVSVLVSRQENRVYVRQGFETVMTGGFTLADPELPLGTHAFTAHAETHDESRLSWTVTSLPDRTTAPAAGTALQALARVQFDPPLAEAIARRLWAGASLILSDRGLGPETGRGTDFVVLTR
jgi:hypothetical protein